MPWTYLAVMLPLAEATSPIGTASGDIVTYILGFGPLGIGIVLYTLGIIVPGKAVKDAIAASRADLLEENKRLIAEKEKADAERLAALAVANDKLVPIVASFVATSGSLIPIMQDLVSLLPAVQEIARKREG